MKALNLITLVLTILAGIEVGLVGLIGLDVLAYLFGAGTLVTRLIEIIFGLSALYQLVPFARALRMGEIRAEVARY